MTISLLIFFGALFAFILRRTFNKNMTCAMSSDDADRKIDDLGTVIKGKDKTKDAKKEKDEDDYHRGGTAPAPAPA